MKIKQFLIYSIVYIGIVGIIVFSQYSHSYTFSILGFNLTLPVVIWFILPLAVYAVFCILHMIYSGYSMYKNKKAISRDLISYDLMAKEILLGLDSNKEFKTDFFKDPGEVTKYLSPWYDLDNDLKISNEELRNVIEILQKVRSGEYVDLKKYKLPKTNPLFLQNEMNRLKLEPKYAHEILKSKSSFDDNLTKKAYEIILNTESYMEIKKYKIPQTLDEINIVINRYANDETFEISREDLFSLINNQNFNEQDFINFAKQFGKKMTPDVLLAMFERLKNENSQANEAYLYILYEVGMIDELREQISLSDGDEYEKFKILIFLKDNNKNIPASLLF